MKFLSIKNLAMTGALSVAGVGLVGVGTHAVFTAQTVASQSIQAGTLSLVLSTASTGATGGGTPNLTFAPLTNVGSSFSTGADTFTITNNGTIPANEVAIQLGDQNNNATLQGETWACLYQLPGGIGVPAGGYIYGNEPLTTMESYGQTAILGTIPVGQTDQYTVVYYAGETTQTDCGGAFTSIGGPFGAYLHSWQPIGIPLIPASTNSAALSLTNPAEGGTLIPTVTVTYNG
jgi:predicted ribosomally synthesized peptide with SipW-like signal peptide